jgi:hypothetical protein
MKYTLFLLAAMVGAVCGAELGVNIQGVTTIGDDPCSAGDEEVLYEECVCGMWPFPRVLRVDADWS